MNENHHKTTFYLSQDLREELIEWSHTLRISQGRFIRESIKKHIKQLKKQENYE